MHLHLFCDQVEIVGISVKVKGMPVVTETTEKEFREIVGM